MLVLRIVNIILCMFRVSAVFQSSLNSIAPCSPSQDRCQNGGFCVVAFGVHISCTCRYVRNQQVLIKILNYNLDLRVGFTGTLCERSESVIIAPITHPTTTQSFLTAAAVAPCSANQDRCQNGGFCVILFGRDIQCTCRYIRK